MSNSQTQNNIIYSHYSSSGSGIPSDAEIQQRLVRAALDAKIPRDAVTQREAGGGRSLSYLEGHYVIDRLNQVLGHENWDKSVIINKLYDGKTTIRGKETHYASYSAHVTLTVRFPNGVTRTIEDYGFGDGQDAYNPGKTHELAIKEAVTDGLKRCAKDLGMSMGLALYSKDQENVEEVSLPSSDTPKRSSAPASPKLEPAPKVTETKTNEDARKTLKAIANVLFKSNKMEVTAFRTRIKDEYGVEKVDDLTPELASKFVSALKTEYKELNT